MAARNINSYQPVDNLYLWWTGHPLRPVSIGELGTVHASGGVSLSDPSSWLAAGFPLNGGLPLLDTALLPSAKETAAGPVDDARPDHWCKRAIRFLDRPSRLCFMAYLYIAGDERFSALGVSTSNVRRLLRHLGPLPQLADVAQKDELMKKAAAGEPVLAEHRRPPMSRSRRRARAWGTRERAQLLRRRGVAESSLGRARMAEVFRRKVFNILIDNIDDHEKNHALLMTDRGEYELSPAFDVLPSRQALGYQQMRVCVDMADSTMANALPEHGQFGLKRGEAATQLRQVVAGVAVVAGWKHHFAAAGVRAFAVESLSQPMDRPLLADRRRAWSGTG